MRQWLQARQSMSTVESAAERGVAARQQLLLLAVSLCIYLAISSWTALLQLLLATGLTYWLAQHIESAHEPRRRRRLLQLGIVLLAGNLAACKYDIAAFDLLLPVGMSFYTFQLIAYLVDVYRGQAAEHEPATFFNFIAFFPKLVAGPIERARDLLPQLHERARVSSADALEGTQQIIWGAFKKIVVADHLGIFVDHVYDAPHAHDGAAIIAATLLYAFQIYCDFSGYADMALGSARVLGYKLTPNFNRPYCATSIQDFWKRWHITLGAWLTDYVYAPLLRQRLFRIKLYYTMLLGIMVTFLVSGIWHGAHWNFVIWGALHGCYTVASVQLLKPWSTFAVRSGLVRHPSLHRALKMGATFSLVCFAYLFFRGNSVSDSLLMIGKLGIGWDSAAGSLARLVGIDPLAFVVGALGTLAVMAYEARPIIGRGRLALAAACVGAVLLVWVDHDTTRQFIYYRF